MKKSRIHILIVDDDAAQGKALNEVFKRAGYQTTWCSSSVQAITAAQRTEFHILLVDCMLPKMNGVDLVEEILQFSLKKPKVFLFSGIFKDKKFIKDACDRTGALEFFDKPLDLKQVLARVEDCIDSETSELPALLSLYGVEPMSDQDLIQLIEQESPLNSIHLPVIYRHLQKSRLTGEMTLITAVGDLNTISFWEGKIFSVRTPDKDSYFGGLAVSFGFVSPDDVIEALKAPSGTLLGQQLIKSFALSPHAIQVIMEEQLALRLSQTLQSGVVSLQWSPKKFETPEIALNPVRYESLINEWVASKLATADIHAQLDLWSNARIDGDFHPDLTEATSLDLLISNPAFKAAKDIPYVFRKLIQGQAHLTTVGEDTRNFAFLEHRLDRLLEEHKTQNFFQILGVGERAHSNELNKAYNEMKQHFDPARLPKDAPASLLVKGTKVFECIQEAYNTLIDEIKRNSYLLQLQNKRSQEKLEAEPLFRVGVLELTGGHPKEAAKKFQSLIDRKIEFRDLKSYRIWAGLKCDRSYKDLTLDQVPPEERHSSAYLMAKGVYYKTRRQYKKALEAFRAAHAMDPQLDIARAEIKKLLKDVKASGTSKDILGDVTHVVENFFSKISRKGA